MSCGRRIAPLTISEGSGDVSAGYHEQLVGWNAYLNRARTITGVVSAYEMFQQILRDFAAMQVVAFDTAAGERFETLRRQHVRIGTMDLRIASSALAKGYTVLTRNLVDFRKVPGLTVEDWTTDQ